MGEEERKEEPKNDLPLEWVLTEERQVALRFKTVLGGVRER